jgi:hypothetical protein
LLMGHCPNPRRSPPRRLGENITNEAKLKKSLPS